MLENEPPLKESAPPPPPPPSSQKAVPRGQRPATSPKSVKKPVLDCNFPPEPNHKLTIWNKSVSMPLLAPLRTPPGTPGHKLAAQRLRTFSKVITQASSKPPAFAKWNHKHHMSPQDFDRPKALRSYFSLQESESSLRGTLRSLSTLRPGTSPPSATLSERQLRKGEPNHPLTHSPLSADAELGPAELSLPARRSPHGGTMHDRDGESRGWNSRHHTGAGNRNHIFYGAHREYFSQPSLFDEAASQSYRRQRDYEISPGVWRSGITRAPTPLGALGVALASTL